MRQITQINKNTAVARRIATSDNAVTATEQQPQGLTRNLTVLQVEARERNSHPWHALQYVQIATTSSAEQRIFGTFVKLMERVLVESLVSDAHP
jgi:hypothetical protein